MDGQKLALLAAGALAIMGASGSRRRKSARPTKMSKADRFLELDRIRGMSDYYSAEFNSMPNLASYLITIGFRESNFNPSVIRSSNDPMIERGLFGMRPDTVFKKANGLESMLSNPKALLDPKWSFVCAVYHIWNACDRVHEKGLVPNFAAIRRWWWLPSLVYDYDLKDERSQSSLGRLEKAIADCNAAYGTGIDTDFIWQPIQGWQNYPGMDTMLKVYGLRL